MSTTATLYAAYQDGELVDLGELIYDTVLEDDGTTRLYLTSESPRQFEFPRDGRLRDVYFVYEGQRVSFNIPDTVIPPRDVMASAFELSDEDPFK